MFCSFFLFLVCISPQQASPTIDSDFTKTVELITDAWTKNCLVYKKLNGNIDIDELDKYDKHFKVRFSVDFDGVNCLIKVYLNNNELRHATLSRNYNGLQQLIGIGINEDLKKPVIVLESYSTSSNYNDVYIVKNDRTFMSHWPTAAPFHHTSHLRTSLLDLFDYPAFKLKGIKKWVEGKAEYVQIDYVVDQVINEKEVNPNKIWGLKEGSVILRPDMNWLITKTEYVMDHNKATRKWQSVYTYDTQPNKVPIIKSIKTRTIDDNPEAKKMPLQTSSDFQLKIVETRLPIELFSLKQFGLEERTPQDSIREQEQQKQDELKEQNTFAPTPAGGFPIAPQSLTVSPWLWLTAAGVLLVVVSFVLFRFARKKSV